MHLASKHQCQSVHYIQRPPRASLCMPASRRQGAAALARLSAAENAGEGRPRFRPGKLCAMDLQPGGGLEASADASSRQVPGALHMMQMRAHELTPPRARLPAPALQQRAGAHTGSQMQNNNISNVGPAKRIPRQAADPSLQFHTAKPPASHPPRTHTNGRMHLQSCLAG